MWYLIGLRGQYRLAQQVSALLQLQCGLQPLCKTGNGDISPSPIGLLLQLSLIKIIGMFSDMPLIVLLCTGFSQSYYCQVVKTFLGFLSFSALPAPKNKANLEKAAS